MTSEIKTYCQGPNLRVTRDFTNHDLMELCERLTARFNEEFKVSEFLFAPEPISEGGIQMVNFPGHGDISRKFKTMRVYFSPYPWTYPWVNLEKWRAEAPITLVTPTIRSKIGTRLKAFDGAPAWTHRELNLVLEELARYGFVSSKARGRLSYEKQMLKQRLKYK